MTRAEILKAASQITGWMLESELAWLIEQASTRRRIVEIGSWKGRSTKALSLAALEVVYSVDDWMEKLPTSVRRKQDADYQEVAKRGSAAVKAEFLANVAPEIQAGKCVVLGVPSEFGPSALKALIGDRKVDMIFIDGDHDYEAVKRDIELWRPMLERGGLLCGHDYEWPGVHTAVAELVPDHRFLHDTRIWFASRS